jgi:enamine deaminase RidA (YjgF/YER057c/UK114 family)
MSASEITRIEVKPHLSNAVVHGGIAYLAGVTPATGVTVAEQTASVLAQIDGLLAAAGTDKSRLLTAQIWLTDIRGRDEMNAVWNAWVTPGNPPARACTEAKLAQPEWRVEIMVTAAIA